MDYEADRYIGECPYTATPCRAYCGMHAGGKCALDEPPEGVEIAECEPASPRAWYLACVGEVEGR